MLMLSFDNFPILPDCIHSNIFREEQLRWTFKLYDASGDGVLEQPEVRLCHRVTLTWKIPLEIEDFPKIKKWPCQLFACYDYPKG